MFFDGSYILQEEPAKNKFADNALFYQGTIPTGTFYGKNNEILAQGFDEFKVFQDGWIMLVYKENKQLFNLKNKVPVFENFIDCNVLGNGSRIAIRKNSILYKVSNWDIYDKEGNFLSTVQNVQDFLGDHLFLVASKDEPKEYTLIDENQKELISRIVKCKKFTNNCFALTFNNGSSAFYSSEGLRISAVVGENVDFLPDGTFVHDDLLHPAIRYNSSGIMIKEELYRYEDVSSYYLLIKSMLTELFNSKGEKVEENVFIADKKENFVIFQKESKYHLYNQFGKVFEFNIV